MQMTEEQLDRAFLALADPTRRSILATLAQGEAGVMELAAPFSISQPAVTKHLKVLESAGLISRRKDAQRRLSRLEPQRLQQMSEWLGSYREYWEESFERLDALVAEIADTTERESS